MGLTAGVIAAYLAVLIGLAALARRRSGQTHEAFFLANRALGPVLLLLTMAATNFSSFTVLGFSGAGYRIGWAYYPVMAFGTGFIAVTFLVIGGGVTGPGWHALLPPAQLPGYRLFSPGHSP